MTDVVVESNDPEPEESEVIEQPVEQPELEPIEQPEPEPQAHNAQTRIRRLNEEKKALQAEVEALSAKINTPTKEIETIGKPSPEDFVGGVFNPDYIEALTDYKMGEALTKRDREQKTTTRLTAVKDREAEFVKSNPGYFDALSEVTASSLINDGLIYEALIDDDNAPRIVFYLGNNPEELAKIENLSVHQKIMKLGAISASFDNQSGKPTPISRAAKPITPIGSGNVPVSKADKIAAAEKSGDYDAWKEANKLSS